MLPRAPLVVLLLVLASFAGFDAGANHGGTYEFDHLGGNEWWVEMDLDVPAGSSPDQVAARDTGGDWVVLENKWGKWVGGFHIEPGHEVQFRVVAESGRIHEESCWFSHPEGVERCEDDATPPPGGEFDAAFHPYDGNEWWVQAKVASDRALAGVDARLDGGGWQALELKSWGAWARSLHAPEGTIVEFRARAEDGSTDVSGKYRWPEGALVEDDEGTPPPPGDFDASFRPKAGNEYWVEVYVDANEGLSAVHVQVEGQDWRPLTKRSWGAWATSFHIPEGSILRFRATSADGDQDLSGHYRWPDATPVDAPDTTVWPREGSFAKYEVEAGESVPGYFTEVVTNVTYTYLDGKWRVACEGYRVTRIDENEDKEPVAHDGAVSGPPRGPTSPYAGDIGEVENIVGCRQSTLRGEISGPHQVEATRHGEDVTAFAWRIDFEPEWPQDIIARWEVDTGLTLRWHNAMSHSWEVGRLVDTDAPLAAEDDDVRPPERNAWPFAGSYVEYHARSTGENHGYFGNTTLEFQDGFWQGVCEEHRWTESRGDNYRRIHVVWEPMIYPTDVEPGQVVEDRILRFCDGWQIDVQVMGQFPEDTTRNGEHHRARVWWADELDGDLDADGWWDVDTGLLLRWENTEEWTRMKGQVTNTDAPLSSY